VKFCCLDPERNAIWLTHQAEQLPHDTNDVIAALQAQNAQVSAGSSAAPCSAGSTTKRYHYGRTCCRQRTSSMPLFCAPTAMVPR